MPKARYSRATQKRPRSRRWRLLTRTRKARLGPARAHLLPKSPSSIPMLFANSHIEFREAGAEVLQALTFYASRDKLATVGLEDRVEDINRTAVRVAKEVAGEQCLVAGNLSLTWMYEPDSPSGRRSCSSDL